MTTGGRMMEEVRAAISSCSTAGSKGAATGTAGLCEEREEEREWWDEERIEREDDMDEDGAVRLRPVEEDLGVCMAPEMEGRK